MSDMVFMLGSWQQTKQSEWFVELRFRYVEHIKCMHICVLCGVLKDQERGVRVGLEGVQNWSGQG
jgi:hypothetical protein